MRRYNLKKVIKILVLFAVCLAASACKVAPDEDATYKIETGEVTNDIYKIALDMKNSYGSSINFKRIKIVRDYLYEKTYSIAYHGVIKSGATKDEIQQFLSDFDTEASSSYIDSQIKFLESNGNLIYLPSDSSESMITLVYIQKE